MIGRGLNASAVRYVLAASPLAYAASGSTAPVWFGDHDSVTLVVMTGSLAGPDFTVNMERSATSNGTFATFGASVAATLTNKAYIRHFSTQSSAGWYKVAYDIASDGTDTAAILLIGQGSGLAPIDQHSTVVSLSDVNA
jgi:hypothetical protein